MRTSTRVRCSSRLAGDGRSGTFSWSRTLIAARSRTWRWWPSIAVGASVAGSSMRRWRAQTAVRSRRSRSPPPPPTSATCASTSAAGSGCERAGATRSRRPAATRPGASSTASRCATGSGSTSTCPATAAGPLRAEAVDADLAVDDGRLYARGAETLVASWAAYARGAGGAEVLRARGVSIGVFPQGPERGVYNNALLERGLGAAARRRAAEEMEAAYAAADIERYAAWVHETDKPMRGDLESRAYTLDTSTRVMGIALADLRVSRPELEIRTGDWPQYLAHLAMDQVPCGLLAGVDSSAFHVLVA